MQIDGKWGYREVTEDSGADINEGGEFSATDTTLTVTDGAQFAVGQTIIIDSEQMYITAIATNDLTVARGVNGTTAATHDDSSDISIARYPSPIVQAGLRQASRLWKRKDSSFAANAGLARTGRIQVSRGLDLDIKELLGSYRRAPLGATSW